MPVVIVLSLVIQLACAYHAVKTGRAQPWLYLILLFPGIGSALYFFLEMLPDLRQSRGGCKAVKTLLNTLDPQADLKKAARELRISNNVDNKVTLAEQCAAHGLHDEAQKLYESCLSGLYQHDPKILLALAEAHFAQGQYAETRQTLDRLIRENPEFKSPEGHLLYARALEALHENDAALEEYRALAGYYAGAEAKCRLALLLQKLGHTEQARAHFQAVVDYARDAPAFYRRAQKTWINLARQHLHESA